jgi:translation initiation factor 1
MHSLKSAASFPSQGRARVFRTLGVTREQPLPSRIIAKLRMEKKGRGGKTMTVVYDLPQNAAFLKELAGELKRACGTGGAVVDGGVEIQGDLRDRVRDVLVKKGWTVKG